MRRLARILLNAATALSLVLCLTTAALCVRSFWVADSWAQATSEMITVNAVRSNRGLLSVFCGNPQFLVNAGATEARWTHWSGPAARRGAPDFGLRPVLGFAHQALPARGAVGIVPLVAFPIATAVLPAVRLARRQRGHATGRCPTCGYDLRATPDRCPECGTIAPR